MKYIYQEPVITTIEDREIIDPKELKQLFQQLKDLQHTFYIEFEDQDSDHTRSFETVRVLKIDDDMIDIHAFLSGATAKYTAIPFLNIRKVKILANQSLISKKCQPQRAHFFDIKGV